MSFFGSRPDIFIMQSLQSKVHTWQTGLGSERGDELGTCTQGAGDKKMSRDSES